MGLPSALIAAGEFVMSKQLNFLGLRPLHQGL